MKVVAVDCNVVSALSVVMGMSWAAPGRSLTLTFELASRLLAVGKDTAARGAVAVAEAAGGRLPSERPAEAAL